MKNSSSQNLDLNLLKVFAVTYQEKNLKRAANRLSSTAPSVSIKLSKLKNKIGGELFFKTPTGFEPTELADELFSKIEPLLSNLTEAVDFIGGFDPALMTDPITIDIGQNLMPWLAPALYEKLQSSCPNTHLIANFFTETSIERLRKGIVDIGVQFQYADVPKDILEIPIGCLQMVAIVRKDHPYLHEEALVKDLVNYDVAVIEQSISGLGKGGPLLHEMEKTNIPVKVRFRSPSVYAICEILKRTDLILPASIKLLQHNSNDLRAIKILDYPELVNQPISVYMHQKNRHSAKHKWYMDLMKEEIRACSTPE